MDLKKVIRDVPDFPKKGIVFKDITPLLKDAEAFAESIDRIAEKFQKHGIRKVCAIESRGFIFGAALAYRMKLPFVPVRKFGKLPWHKVSQEYQLEYGTDTIEIHTDAVEKGEKVLVVDDVLATGGTAEALCQLLDKIGAKVVGLAFLIELDFLKGRERLPGQEIFSLINY
jgi:adenine phosphoribosyltransferase